MSMQFKTEVSETKETEEIDNAQLARMQSADLIRLKRAHKAEQMFVEKHKKLIRVLNFKNTFI